VKEKTVVNVLAILLIVIAVAVALGAYATLQSTFVKRNDQPSPTPLATANPTPTPTFPPLPTPTPTPTASPTPTQAPLPTPTLAPMPSPTPNPTPTPSPTPTPTSNPTPTPTPSPQPTSSPTPTATPTPTPTPTPPTNATAAINWTGYVISSDLQNPQPSVTGVNASWVVPTVTTSTNNTYSATWIGIGGQFNNDSSLIQCGTEQDSRFGNALYYAWYELLPNPATTIPFMFISPGDQIQASIQLANVTTSQWVINLTDTTTTRSFQTTVTYNSSQLTAEWIVERPTVNHAISQLTDFGNVTFTGCNATVGSASGDIGSFPWEATDMYSSATSGGSSVQLADVSDLSPDGSGFTVNWLSSG